MPFNKTLIKKDFNRYSTSYDTYAHVQRRAAQEVARNVRQHVSPSAKVLDLGCGTGFVAQELKEYSYVTQMDMAYNMCRQAQAYGAVVTADCDHPPFINGAFHAITSSLMLQWSTEPAHAFHNISELLENNGLCITSITANKTLYQLTKSIENILNTPHVSTLPEVQENVRYCETSGLEILHHYLVKETTYHPDLLDLLKHIKHIGAANKLPDRNQSISRNQLKEIEKYYRNQFVIDGQLPADWYIHHIIARKTA